LWLNLSKDNQGEQSKVRIKMGGYVHASQTKLLSDVITAGSEENDSVFINWEKMMKGNNTLKDSKHTSFLEHIQYTLDSRVCFVKIVDASHQNNTVRTDEVNQRNGT